MTTKTLRAPTDKPVVLRAIRPNAGVAAVYRKKLLALVADMNDSLLYWLAAAYRATPPDLAADEESNAAKAMRRSMSRLARRWQRAFDSQAPKLGKWFADSAHGATQAQLDDILKRAGFAVKFTLTPTMREALDAVTTENVGLIRSIAQRHLSEVEGLVMRSVSQGRDLATLTAEIKARYGVTRRRAELIARDQNNKATAVVQRVRQQELGIKQAVWMHSHAGKEPRQSHLKADGKVFDVDKGMYLDGKWVWPGTEINCRCVSRPVIPGFED